MSHSCITAAQILQTYLIAVSFVFMQTCKIVERMRMQGPQASSLMHHLTE